MEKTLSITGAAIPLQAEVSITALAGVGGGAQKVVLAAGSVQSTAIGNVTALVTPDTAVFYREGSDPTALANGTDQILLANVSYRIAMTLPTNELAFIPVSGSSGNVYITPGG